MKLTATMRTGCAALLLLSAGAYAQRGGGMRGGGMGMPGGGMHGGGVREGFPRNAPPGAAGMPRARVQMSPPGRWWDDRKFARSLNLNDDQKKRMDNVFSQNRGALKAGLSNLQKAQSRLDDVKNSAHPTEAALAAEIDHVAQARADLEKTYTHMVLQLRDELTPEQIGKLDEARQQQ